MQNYWPWEYMVEALWKSGKLVGDDKAWIDKISMKKVFKFTEIERIEGLCIKIFSAVPKYNS